MNEIVKTEEKTSKEINLSTVGVFNSIDSFQNAQRIAKALSTSNIIPENYRGDGNVGNILVALEMANRMNASPISVMQNLDIIQGKPSWASSFVIAMINSCGKFSTLKFEYKDFGEQEICYQTYDKYTKNYSDKKRKIHNKSCRAYAIDLKSNEKVYSPEVTIEMAVKDGWFDKSGSKWKTIPDLMLSYRAATFFGRLYAPEILQGLHTEDENKDIFSDESKSKVETIDIDYDDVLPLDNENTKSDEPIKEQQPQQLDL